MAERLGRYLEQLVQPDGSVDEKSTAESGNGSSSEARQESNVSGQEEKCTLKTNPELAQLYWLRCGAVPGRSSDNLFTLLRKREDNAKRFGQMTSRDCRKISSRYVPNGVTAVKQYSSRAFCSQFNHRGDIFSVAFQDRHIRLYHTDGGQDCFQDIYASDVGWSIVDTAFSPDSRFLIYSTWSPCVQLYSVDVGATGPAVGATGPAVHEQLDLRPDQARFCLFSLQFSSDSKEMIGGGNDGRVHLYDIEQKRPTLQVVVSEEDVNSVKFVDPNCNVFLTGADDGVCKMWDKRCLDQGANPISEFVGHFEGITHVDVNRDGRFFVSNGKNQCIKLWDFRKPKANSSVATEKTAPRWDYRWESYEIRNVRQKMDVDTSIMTYRGHRVLETLIRCYFSPDFSTSERYIYTGSQCGTVHVFDVLTGRSVNKLTAHSGIVRDVAWHPTKPILISSSWDGTVARWEYV